MTKIDLLKNFFLRNERSVEFCYLCAWFIPGGGVFCVMCKRPQYCYMTDVLMSWVVSYIIGANKFYRDQLMCREQEPWLFRGGLLGEIQVSWYCCSVLLLLPVAFVQSSVFFHSVVVRESLKSLRLWKYRQMFECQPVTSDWFKLWFQKSAGNRALTNWLVFVLQSLSWNDFVSSCDSHLLVFIVRRYALHGICYSNCVCLSVCLSVPLSHSWTVSTWFDLRSWFLHHMVAPSF